MPRRDWTKEENDLIIADYFAMLAHQCAGRRYNKTAHRRRLMIQIKQLTQAKRSEGSIEYKHQNISTVLDGLGVVWLKGYPPASNIQLALADAVKRWLDMHPEWVDRLPDPVQDAGSAGTGEIEIGQPPTLSNRAPPNAVKKLVEIGAKLDFAGRDARNRALGRAGEERVLGHERAVLSGAGRTDLARQVRWVSEEDGDGAGYDIGSFDTKGRPRLIEVKTTNRGERTPFHITPNELHVSEKRPSEWVLLRLWDFSREAKAFELCPPLERHVELIAESYRAHLR